MIRFSFVFLALFTVLGVAHADKGDAPVAVVTPSIPETKAEKGQFDLVCHQEVEQNNPYLTLRVIADGKGKYFCSLGRLGVWSANGYRQIGNTVECEAQVAFLETAQKLWELPGNGDMILHFRNLKEGIDLSINVGTRLPVTSARGARYKGKMTVRLDDANQPKASTYKVTCDASTIKDKDGK